MGAGVEAAHAADPIRLARMVNQICGYATSKHGAERPEIQIAIGPVNEQTNLS